MSKYYNIGDTVGYWTLIEEVPKPEGRVYNGIYWNCKCKCGTEREQRKMTFKKIRNGYYICEENDNLYIRHTNVWWIGYDKRVAERNHIVAKRNSRRDIFKEMNRIYDTGIKK